MSVTVEVVDADVTVQPVVVSASVGAPIDVDVTSPAPVVVDLAPTTLAAAISGGPSVTVAVAGAQGVPGPGGAAAMVIGETPAGAVDGINAVFTTAAAFQAGATGVYLNGLREQFYTELSSTSIEFDTAPLTGDLITIDYLLQ